MRPVAEYRAQIFSGLRLTQVETLSYLDAVGRFLAEDVVAPHSVPSFANSAMDGFAVRGVDVSSPGAVLEIVDEIAAGVVGQKTVERGQASKIMTGAPMPPGADTVVRVEDTSTEDGKVQIDVEVVPGTAVRPIGGDVEQGAVVFSAGSRLSEAHIGTLATIGVTDVVVHKRPTVAVMSTGDELVEATVGELAPGMIRDSNRPMLVMLARGAGADVLDLGRIPDDADALRSALGEAAVGADLIVTSGGVSMGDFDVVKAVLSEEAGVEFFPVAMKPGKPQGYGQLGGKPFFGLPGNPVSVLVSFEQFVRPAILAMQGANKVLRPRASLVAGQVFESDPLKEEFVRVTVLDGAVHKSGGDGSHVLSGAANADVFLVMDVGVERVETGESVTVEMFRATEGRAFADG